jgi:hypothetical protein
MKHTRSLGRSPQPASGEMVAAVGIVSGSVVAIVMGLSAKIWLDRNLDEVTNIVSAATDGSRSSN